MKEVLVNYKYEKIKWLDNLQIKRVLSFNYTDTFERVYGKSGHKVVYDYIHGKVRNEISEGINNMVIGIDEYLTIYERKKNVKFIRFQKYFQRIYKKTGCKYKKWLRKKCSDATFDKEGAQYEWEGKLPNDNCKDRVYIYGHSLDVTDGDVLKEFLLADYIKVIIFYYDDEAYAQYITNLISIMGQDKLIEKVYGEDPGIEFEDLRETNKSMYRI